MKQVALSIWLGLAILLVPRPALASSANVAPTATSWIDGAGIHHVAVFEYNGPSTVNWRGWGQDVGWSSWGTESTPTAAGNLTPQWNFWKFLTDPQGHLQCRTTGGSWGRWDQNSSGFTVASQVGTPGADWQARDQSMAVAAIDPQNGVWMRSFSAASASCATTSGALTALGGGAVYSPSLAQMADGQHVVVTATDGQVWQWWTGGAWQALGGASTGSVSATSWDMRTRLDVFIRSSVDNSMWHKWWDGTGWSGWETQGGVALASGPGCTSWGSDRIDCFAIGPDSVSVWHKWWSGSSGWAAWENLGHA